MPISEAFLHMLVCPINRQKLILADATKLREINQFIEQSQIKTSDGDPFNRPLEAALITVDGKHAYPIFAGVPHLLPSACIALHSR